MDPLLQWQGLPSFGTTQKEIKSEIRDDDSAKRRLQKGEEGASAENMRRPLLRKEYLDEIALIHQTALTLDGGSHREEKNPPTLQTERRPGGNNKSRRRNTNFNKRKQFIGEEGNEEQEEIKHQDKDEPNAEQEEEGNTSLLQGVATGIEVALAVYDDLREMARWV